MRVGYFCLIEKAFFLVKKAVLERKEMVLNRTWELLKTENLKYAFLNISDEAKKLMFILKSFFWDRTDFKLYTYSNMLHVPLRVYYKDEDDNISHDICKKFSKGFLSEPKRYVRNYWPLLWQYPKLYLKHLLKVVYFTRKIKQRRWYGTA